MHFFTFTPDNCGDCNVRAWTHSANGSDQMVQLMYPAVVICPGGAYEMIADIEADPVAEQFFAAGFNVFILNYSIGENAKDFGPLIQLASTIAHIRNYSEEYCTEKHKIAVCGFSAGGHLAASSGTLFNEPRFLEKYAGSNDIRPDAMILSYPVITSDEFAHVGSIENVSADKNGGDTYNWFGLDQRVDAQTPPTFLWHTAEDEVVPVENSLKMALALSGAGVPFEMHIFPFGGHGMSVCNRTVGRISEHNAHWVDLCINWLRMTFQISPFEI